MRDAIDAIDRRLANAPPAQGIEHRVAIWAEAIESSCQALTQPEALGVIVAVAERLDRSVMTALEIGSTIPEFVSRWDAHVAELVADYESERTDEGFRDIIDNSV
jgi:hypothetical protein